MSAVGENETIVAVANAAAGSAGGILSMALLYPLDSIRLRLQVQHKTKDERSHEGARKLEQQQQSPTEEMENEDETGAVRPYKGAVDCFCRVVQEEGWQELYRGLRPSLVGIGVSSAVFFFWHSLLKSQYIAWTGSRSFGTFHDLALASAAGTLNALSTVPIWVVQNRIALENDIHSRNRQGNDTRSNSAVGAAGAAVHIVKQTGMLDMFRRILSTEGIEGLYSGLVPALILVSNPAIQFATYEQLVRLITAFRLRRMSGRDKSQVTDRMRRAASRLSSIQYFIVGAIAKALATTATYPYQVVKSRLQADGNTYKGTLDCIFRILREEGVSAFFSGMSAKMFQTVMTASFMFVFYEKILRVALYILTRM